MTLHEKITYFYYNTFFFSFALAGQEMSCSGNKLQAVYYFCKSNPNDTAFKHLYFYNKFEQLDRIDKYENHDLESIIKCIYDSNNVLLKTYVLYEETIQNLCGDTPIDLCYDKLKDRIYDYDSVTGSCYFIFGKSLPQKHHYDSIFVDGKLRVVLNDNDTLYTFDYDQRGKLTERIRYCSNRKSYIERYKYKDLKTFEYTYPSIDSKKPTLITELEYDSSDRVIKKTTISIPRDMKPKLANTQIVEKFRYLNNRLVEYEIYDDNQDPAFGYYCSDRYKKYYVYVD